MRFDEFVQQRYAGSADAILDRFHNEISNAAQERGIDWASTRSNVVFGDVVKGRNCIPVSKEDRGRVSVRVDIQSRAYEIDNHKFSVRIPYVRFVNWSSDYINPLSGNDGRPEPVYVDVADLLWSEFQSALSLSQPIERYKFDEVAAEKQRQTAEEKRKELDDLAKQIKRNDFEWYQRGEPIKSWPYYTEKGVPFLFEQLDIRKVTEGSKAYAVVPLVYPNNTFSGLHRMDVSGNPSYRTLYNPTRSCARFGQFVDGQPIVVQESIADSSFFYRYTNITCAAALYADNIIPLCEELRALYPNSFIFHIYDDDVASRYNKGKLVADGVMDLFKGQLCAIASVPLSDQLKKKGFKDVTDYLKIFGLLPTKEMVMQFAAEITKLVEGNLSEDVPE
jgi:hypothetical protein